MATEPKITGIYKIVNTVNGHKYVGSAVDIKRRWRKHKSDLKRNNHHSQILQRAWNKHGEDVFEFSIIEECSPVKEILISREQFWIDTLNAYGKNGYNISKAAGSPMMGRKHTEETLKKMSESQKGVPVSQEAKDKIGNAHRGKIVSEEIREKLRIANRNPSVETRIKMGIANIGRQCSPETRGKISAALSGRVTPNDVSEKQKLARKENQKKVNDLLLVEFLKMTALLVLWCGHKATPRISMHGITLDGIKYCTHCKLPKHESSFYLSKKSLDGFSHQCKACVGVYNRVRNNEYDERENDQPKLCPMCNIIKSKGDFGRYRRTSDGLTSHCKSCNNEYARKQYASKNKGI